jgi:protein-L-isoaspartate(D-aspartate) O-methyltransferase
MLQPDGTQVPQTSRPELIREMLRLLDVPKASCVLEVGTGSGYSTALLCMLVGDEGSVISLDVDEEMVGRGSALLSQDGFASVEVLRRDGRLGHAAGAPYERLVAWAAADDDMPAVWLEQVSPGGVIVAPLRERRVLKLRVTAGRTAIGEAAMAAGFIPLTAEPFRPWEAAAESSSAELEVSRRHG